MYPTGIEIDMASEAVKISRQVMNVIRLDLNLPEKRLDDQKADITDEAFDMYSSLMLGFQDLWDDYIDKIDRLNYEYTKETFLKAIKENSEVNGGIQMSALTPDLQNGFHRQIRGYADSNTRKNLTSFEMDWRKSPEGMEDPEVESLINKYEKKIASSIILAIRNAIASIYFSLTETRGKASGAIGYKWRGRLDARERKLHLAREGVIFKFDDPPSDGHPGQPINCRCYAELVYKIQESIAEWLQGKRFVE